jgi:hypothetical protein
MDSAAEASGTAIAETRIDSAAATIWLDFIGPSLLIFVDERVVMTPASANILGRPVREINSYNIYINVEIQLCTYGLAHGIYLFDNYVF